MLQNKHVAINLGTVCLVLMANKHNVCLVTDWPNFNTAHFTVYDCTLHNSSLSLHKLVITAP